MRLDQPAIGRRRHHRAGRHAEVVAGDKHIDIGPDVREARIDVARARLLSLTISAVKKSSSAAMSIKTTSIPRIRHACSKRRDARQQDGRVAGLLNGLGSLGQTGEPRRRRQIGPRIFLDVVDGRVAQGEAGDLKVDAVGRPAPGSSPGVDDVIVGDFLGEGRFRRAGREVRASLPSRTMTSSSIQVYCSGFENHRSGPPRMPSGFQLVVAGAQNRRGARSAEEQRHAIRLLVIQAHSTRSRGVQLIPRFPDIGLTVLFLRSQIKASSMNTSRYVVS